MKIATRNAKNRSAKNSTAINRSAKNSTAINRSLRTSVGLSNREWKIEVLKIEFLCLAVRDGLQF